MLTACQQINGLLGIDAEDGKTSGAPQGYPELRSVPPPPESRYSIETRRQIVRDLLDVRDGARYNKSVVRHRSGLSEVPPAAPPAAATNADDIVRGGSSSGDEIADTLSGEDVPASGPIYKNKTQVDNGGLDDFMRQLRRDTLPTKPASEPVGDGNVDESTLFDLDDDTDHLVVLNALAPLDRPLGSDQGILKLRLAASESGLPWYCMFLAWSGVCAEEETNAGQADGKVAADLERDKKPQDETVETTPSDSADSQTDGEAVAGQDAAKAIEDLGESAMAPVSDSLDRLRNLLRSRARTEAAPARDDRSLAYQDDALRPVEGAESGPPTPSPRPDVAKDLVVLGDSGRFVFSRTPRPAFKPTPPGSEAAILPPARPSAGTPSNNRRRPARRPDDLVGPVASDQQPPQKTAETPEPQPAAGEPDREEMTTAMVVPSAEPEPTASVKPPTSSEPSTSREPSTSPEPPTSSEPSTSREPPTSPEPSTSSEPSTPADPKPPSSSTAAVTSTTPAESAPSQEKIELAAPLAGQEVILDEEIIRFEANATTWPDGTQERLIALLDEAKAVEGKIHIIGEADLSHLATARAKDVGQALVQLGATADLLHYDTAVVAGTDQVRLLLKPAEPDLSSNTAGTTSAIE